MSGMVLMASSFGLASSFVLLIGLIWTGRDSRVATRLEDLSQAAPRTSKRAAPGSADKILSRMGSVIMPENVERQRGIEKELRQAGLYQRGTLSILLGLKIILMVGPMLLVLALAGVGLIPLGLGILCGTFLGLFGTLAPKLLLRHLKAKRQTTVRRALPDALDVVVICLEGGLSLPGALARVAVELRTAHPLLASEMNIVQREVQLGSQTGEALRQLADRIDLDEVRSLASVVNQSERFGASLVKALRVHAETLRVRRHQYAEAQAHKAPVKLIFPTVLCIFPALYIVLMGPALAQVFEMLEDLGS